MAKLTKVAQKIFGSGAGTNQISQFGSLFAGSPAFTTSPVTAQSLSNWLTGWLGAAIGGNSPAIEDMNAVHFVTTYQLAYLMQAGVAEWDAGTTYYTGSFVNVSGVLYISLTDDNLNNLVSDTSNWKVFSTDPTGVGKDYFGVTLPAGWVWASGKTIGNASSNATERANADTFDLFKLLWDNYSNSILPIYDSAGVASIRGASAAADFAANKALQVIDKRGRVSVGLDNLGGTAANRVTSTTMTPDGTTIGASGGEQTHALTIAELAAHDHGGGSHTHNILPGGTTAYILGGSGGSNNAFTTGSANQYSATATDVPNSTVVASQGSGTAHNTMQPSVLCNYIIKL